MDYIVVYGYKFSGLYSYTSFWKRSESTVRVQGVMPDTGGLDGREE